jgi:hypothetical protein
MPLIETVSLLTSLASAYQVLRTGKPGDAPPTNADAAEASGAVFAYELARQSYETSLQRLDATRAHLTLLAGMSGLTTLVAVLAVRAFESSAGFDSAFVWASLILALVIVAGAVATHLMTSPRVISSRSILLRSADAPLQLMDEYVKLAVSHADQNERSLSLRAAALDLILVIAAVNLVLLVAWALTV